jgi:hypothetical protein
MAVPANNLDRVRTVTTANPTPPSNVAALYQGTPPTPYALGGTVQTSTLQDPALFANPLNGAAAPELSGRSESDGTEVTTSTPDGRVTGHSVSGAYVESPNGMHPSYLTTGADLVTNGDFLNGTGWTLTGGANINRGNVNMSGSGAGQVIRPAAAAITAGDYVYAFDVVTTDGVGVVSVIIGGTTFPVPQSNVAGHFGGIMTTTASAQTVGLLATNLSACLLDNFRVMRKL